MRLTTVILLASLLQVSASTFGQHLSLQRKGITLEQVFKEIRQQTGYDILLSTNEVKVSSTIDANFKKASIEEVMDQIVTGRALTYSIEDKTILLKPKAPSFLDKAKSVILNLVQDLTVNGVINDESGKPLSGATVLIKGTDRVTKTNEKGEFVLANVPDDGVLVIRYVGYKQLEISLKDAVMPLEIKLNVATGELEEVKVVYNTGYQELNKERSTGSFVQIDNELFNRTVSTNVLDRILNVTNSLKFEPRPVNTSSSNSSNITIRGFSTIGSNMKPLIVIDGFPYASEGDEANNGQNFLLNNLNPNDVESVTVLRDAAAASIWGARAANGVIVIATKKGKFNNQSKIGFTANVNFIDKPNLNYLQIISSHDAVEYERSVFKTGYYNQYDDIYPGINYFPQISPVAEILLAQKRGELTEVQTEVKLNAFKQHDVRDDINKYMLRQSINQQYNLNINGGSEINSYYASVGYDRNIQNAVGNDNSRLTIRLDNTFRPLKHFELNGYIVYTQSSSSSPLVDYTRFLPTLGGTIAPYTFLADEQGNALATPNGYRETYLANPNFDGLLDWYYRPLDEIKNSNNKTNLNNARLGASIKYFIIPGLSAEIKGQYEQGVSKLKNYKSLKTYETRDRINILMYRNASGILQYPVPLGGILDQTDGENKNWNLRAVFNFNRTWTIHQLNAIAGTEVSEQAFDSNISRKYGYDPNINLIATNVDYNTLFTARPSGGGNRVFNNDRFSGRLTRLRSYFGNAGYTYNGKYTVTTSARIDGSNFFGVKANQRFVPLWSAGVAWDIYKEINNKNNLITALKVRVTYGYNGNMNNGISALPIISYNNAGSSYNPAPNSRLKSPPNPGIRWERVRMANFAIDFGLFNNRISGNVEYYRKNATDLIGPLPIESTVGVSNYMTNYANMKGKGVDLILNTKNLTGNFSWNTNLLYSYNTDKVTNYNRTSPLTASVLVGSPGIPQLDMPLTKIYSYPSAGLDPMTGNPRGYVNGKVVDFNVVLGNTTKPEDLKYHGRNTPSHFGAIQNTFSYQNLSVSFNITYRFGYYFKRSSINYSNLLSSWNGHSDYAKRWKQPGDELFTTIPSLPTSNDSRYSFYENSSDVVEKGDHIRLQDVRMDYTFNKVAKKLSLSNASLFIYANNLGILWKANKHGLDPEVSSGLPQSNMLAVGLQVTF